VRNKGSHEDDEVKEKAMKVKTHVKAGGQTAAQGIRVNRCETILRKNKSNRRNIPCIGPRQMLNL
jgi:hypothetical protein